MGSVNAPTMVLRATNNQAPRSTPKYGSKRDMRWNKLPTGLACVLDMELSVELESNLWPLSSLLLGAYSGPVALPDCPVNPARAISPVLRKNSHPSSRHTAVS